ncbi:hypothetical protein HK405_011493 [Cladochytrium tenue]|nr:hypothetical protein HK405_011493 [Cladochytrium tenue]
MPVNALSESGTKSGVVLGLDSRWAETTWGAVQVGDIVLVQSNDLIPADLVILSTSEPDCLCYVETKNLDGETNLKIRKGMMETSVLSRSDLSPLFKSKTAQDAHESSERIHIDSGQSKGIRFAVETEPPGPALYTFTGVAIFTAADSDTDVFISAGAVALQLLFASCALRFNHCFYRVYIILSYLIYCDLEMYYDEIDQPCVPRNWNLSDDLGQVEYVFSDKTGTLTRNIMQFRKCSINGVVYGESSLQTPIADRSLVLVDASSASSRTSEAKRAPLANYDTKIPSLEGIARKTVAARGSLLGASVNPTSLRRSMSPPPLPTGQERFSSYTKWSFGPWTYRDSVFSLPEGPPSSRLSGRNEPERLQEYPSTTSSPSAQLPAVETRETLQPFADAMLLRDFEDAGSPRHAAAVEFFACLATCHSVLVSGGGLQPGTVPVRYMAQSPDEAALVQAARDVGVSFLGRGEASVVVDVLGTVRQSELLNVLEFNSTRKRMSVIVRNDSGEIVLYCKGADSVMYELLAPGQDELKSVTAAHLERFADDGLRTLCVAMAVLPEDRYHRWAARYKCASTSLDNRDSQMDSVAAEIERDLLLLGSTAIEDKLQDGVPECIEKLLSADIKVWVLTGDKLETAINIGYSCSLLAQDMILILVREASDNGATDSAKATVAQMEEALERFFRRKSSVGRKSNGSRDKASERYALVIDGHALKYAMEVEGQALFLELATQCAAVICCRVSPLQKAQVVQLVKTKRRVVCLAIGDGANDVSMIQTAQIGIGIAGEEGLQAVMASDYAVAQFRLGEVAADQTGAPITKGELSTALAVCTILNANIFVAQSLRSWQAVSGAVAMNAELERGDPNSQNRESKDHFVDNKDIVYKKPEARPSEAPTKFKTSAWGASEEAKVSTARSSSSASRKAGYQHALSMPEMSIHGGDTDDLRDVEQGDDLSRWVAVASAYSLSTPRESLGGAAAAAGPGGGGLLTVMRTGEMLRNRGFSFSQSKGARDVLMGRDPPVLGGSTSFASGSLPGRDIKSLWVPGGTAAPAGHPPLNRTNTAPG